MPQQITFEVWNFDMGSAPHDRDIILHWDNYKYDGSERDGEKLTAIGFWKENIRTGRSYFAHDCELDDYGMADNPPIAWCDVPPDPRRS